MKLVWGACRYHTGLVWQLYDKGPAIQSRGPLEHHRCSRGSKHSSDYIWHRYGSALAKHNTRSQLLVSVKSFTRLVNTQLSAYFKFLLKLWYFPIGHKADNRASDPFKIFLWQQVTNTQAIHRSPYTAPQNLLAGWYQVLKHRFLLKRFLHLWKPWLHRHIYSGSWLRAWHFVSL